MLLGDFGTSWTKIYDSESREYGLVPARGSRDLRVDVATGHNAGLHSEKKVGELVAMVQGGIKLIGGDFAMLDIGGRDMKFVEVHDKKVTRMEWNTQCGAMTGFTLELVGKYFDVNFSDIPPASKGYPMTCGVLGMERAFDDMSTGTDPVEAVARLAAGIAVAAHKFIGSLERFHLSGGMCDNPLFVESFPEGVQVVPMGRFVLVEGLTLEMESRSDVKDVVAGMKSQ